MEDVRVTDNLADNGGGLNTIASRAELTRVFFQNNTASRMGGKIHTQISATLNQLYL